MNIHTRLPSQANPNAFAQFSRMLAISANAKRLNAALLNSLQEHDVKDNNDDASFCFYDQDSEEDSRYYEEIIYQDKRIPTRNDNWHDYFNGLIWLHYPNTKAYLNALHYQDIQAFGAKQRTAQRDRITHFDECGMLLLTDIPELESRLSAHDWHYIFVEQKDAWFRETNGIVPMHFGHANLEMLCAPFIGLTAKVLVLQDESLLMACSKLLAKSTHLHLQAIALSKELGVDRAAYKSLDQALVRYLQTHSPFKQKGALRPLPLLGIPDWHNERQDATFYANQSYFMPLKRHR